MHPTSSGPATIPPIRTLVRDLRLSPSDAAWRGADLPGTTNDDLEALKAIPDGAPRVLLATGRYIGEGFDDARLDTLFLALPVSWRGTIQQYAGRLHRLHDRKRAVTIVDYVDVRVPMLARMYQKRLLGYAAIGYGVTEP